MNHSIDFYVTADENKIADMENASRVISSRDAVKLRVHSSEMSSSSGQAYLKSHPEGFADSPDGAYGIGAVSGNGITSACGVGDLLARHVTGTDWPAYGIRI